MHDLIAPHDFVKDCDCGDCARTARNKLQAFARAVMAYWPEGAPDGGDLQEIAEKHGLLKPERRRVPCGDGCSCAEYVGSGEWASGVICYRRTALMMGSNVEVRGAEQASPAERPSSPPGSAD